MNKFKVLLILTILLLVLIFIIVVFNNKKIYMNYFPRRTVRGVMNVLRDEIDPRIINNLSNAGFNGYPNEITLIVLKDEKELEVWGKQEGKWVYINKYPIKAASGVAGPKLVQGDRQVPEGIYNIIALNPNSSYHLSMKINYPNYFDKKKANIDGRTNLGGDIFFHGKDVSIGCIAIGDQAIEELFYLVAKVNKENVRVIISPYDFRKREVKVHDYRKLEWLDELYCKIDNELADYIK